MTRMGKVLVTHGVPMTHFELVRPHELIHPAPGKAFSREELLRLLPDCDAVVACGPFDRELLTACGKLTLLVCYGAGYDAIDVQAASDLRIPVVNVPDSVTEATAELAMAQILAVTRRICETDRALRTPGSTRESFTMGRAMGVSLDGMTLGIVGMGRIGSRVAEFGRFLGMRVVYDGRHIKPFSQTGNARRLPLQELLRASDVVSLHCPLTPETAGMIGAEALALMRPTAFLINASRGKLVDSHALAEAIREGRLAGAALDVFDTEPEIIPELRELPTVVLTPHIGSNTLSTRNRMAQDAAQTILTALAGKEPPNLLNPIVWHALHG